MIRPVEQKDHNKITAIYNYYILNSIATFEEETISIDTMGKRIDSITREFPWLVFEHEQKICGYAYACLWNTRSAYRKSAEITIYIEQTNVNKGIGTKLYAELISRLITMGFHVVIGGISLPNKASIALHEKFGLKKVAHFSEVGLKFNKWIDVGYWELILN